MMVVMLMVHGGGVHGMGHEIRHRMYFCEPSHLDR